MIQRWSSKIFFKEFFFRKISEDALCVKQLFKHISIPGNFTVMMQKLLVVLAPTKKTD